MATKAELAKAYDAGQAAKKYGEPDEACPFEPGSDEHKAYMEGKKQPLAEKWELGRGGRALTQTIGE